ncbi:MAG: DUF4156 domain-containing protein [Polyangiales bacterium]
MKARILRRLGPMGLLVFLVGGLASLGCKADQITDHGMDVMLLDDVPKGCENLGVVIGHGGGLMGAYSKPRINRESAENDARNQAAALGATHLLLHPEDVTQGEGRQPSEQDTAPELAHGYGTGSNVTVAGTAFKCAPNMAPENQATTMRAGSALVEVAAPTSISLAPLGQLKSITVFQRVPLPSGTGMTENEVLKVDDAKEIQRVVDSLRQVALDPMKYVPTHRVEFVGELGVQSLLYGFGYLQYAGDVYRLTTGDFEEVLKLRAQSAEPEVETDAPPADVPAEAAPSNTSNLD